MKRAVFVLGIAVLLLALLRQADLRGPIVDEVEPAATWSPTSSTSGLRGLVVLPDDGPDAILDEIDHARASIDLYVYLLPADEVLTSLSAAHDRGVAVRVILEQDPFGGGNSNQDAFDQLDASGIDVRWSDDRFRFSHIKALVIDRRVAMIMSLNLSWSALTRNREFAVVSTEPADVAELARLFDADWSGRPYHPAGDFVTSPDNSRTVFRELIDSATESIEIYAEVVRDDDMRARLIAAAERGVAVRILVPSSPTADALEIYAGLVRHGVDVRLLADAYSHAKVIIVDRSRAFVGSQNLTQTSLDENRECGIILDDAPNLDRLGATFESDWAASPTIS